MRVWSDFSGDPSPFFAGTVTVGKFDGLHLGHQELLRSVAKSAKPGIVLTFDPHPLQVLKPDLGLTKIFPRSDLIEQLPCYGVDVLAIIPFTTALAALSAAEFAERFIGFFRPRQVVVGYDFAFGHKREGDQEWLKRWCGKRGIGITIVAPIQRGGAPISSGRIRELIGQGDVVAVRRLLDRPFYLRGTVVHGAGRGRTIGVPTLNLQVQNETLPAQGVYATRTKLGSLQFDSVTNVGVVPTFTEQARLQVETHLIGVDRNAYGEIVDVFFVKRLRPEKKFASVDDLKKQVEQDILEAKRELQADEKMDVHKPHQ